MLTSSKQSGFSLVELMIAVVIMGILLAAALPSYSSWLENTQIRTAAESIQNGLQLARAEAARRNASASFKLAGNNWSVDVLAMGAASGVFYTPASNVQVRSGTEGSRHATITVTPATVSYNGTAFAGVAFNGLGRMCSTPLNNVTFTIQNPTGGSCATSSSSGGVHCLNVVVEPGGKIRMCDPVLNNSGNPQACVP